MLASLWKGLDAGIRNIRVVLIIYGLQLLLAFPIAMQVFGVLDSTLGDSMEAGKLLKGYDATVFGDYMNHHGVSLGPLIGQVRWSLLVFLIFWVFFSGGIVHCLKERNSRFSTFWAGGGRFFFRFLGISTVVWLVLGLLAMVILIPALSFATPGLEIMPTEREVLYVIGGGVLLFLLLAITVIGIGVVAKIHLVSQESEGIVKSLRRGLKWVFRHFFGVIGVYFFLFFLQVVLILLYFYLDKASLMTTGFLLAVLFLVQQFMIMVRIWMRVILYGTFFHYVNSK